jgi:hypothetical protein
MFRSYPRVFQIVSRSSNKGPIGHRLGIRETVVYRRRIYRSPDVADRLARSHLVGLA